MNDEAALHNIFIEGIDASIRHSLHSYWSTNPPADLTDVALQVKFLLSIQKRLKNARAINFLSTNLGKPYRRKPIHNRKTVNNINTDTTSQPTRSSRRWVKSPPVLNIQPSGTPTTAPSSTPSSSSSVTSVHPSFCKVCYDVNHVTSKCSLLAHHLFCKNSNNMARNHLRINQEPSTNIQQPPIQPQENFFRGRRQPQYSSFGRTKHLPDETQPCSNPEKTRAERYLDEGP